MAGKTKGEEDKKELTNAEKVEQITTDAAKQQRAAATEYVDALNKSAETLETDNAGTRKVISDALNSATIAQKDAYDKIYGENGILAGIYNDQQEALRQKTKDYAKQTQRDYRAAQWAGITEVAAGIANAIGVANGASHQVINPVSKDWMQKAEANEKTRRTHLDQLNENLRAKKEQIAQGKLQGMLAAINAQRDASLKLADFDATENARKGNVATQVAGVKYKAETGAAQTEAEGKLKGVTVAQSDKQHEDNVKLTKERINATKSGSGSGSGFGSTDMRSAFPFTIGDRTYYASKNSIIATMNANADLLSEEDAATLKDIVGDEKLTPEQRANKLLPYMRKYPELEDAMARSAYHVVERDDEEEEEESEERSEESTSGSGIAQSGWKTQE